MKKFIKKEKKTNNYEGLSQNLYIRKKYKFRSIRTSVFNTFKKEPQRKIMKETKVTKTITPRDEYKI